MGMEELVACFRIARAVHAAELPQTENILVTDKQGGQIHARVPVLLLDAVLFPHQPDDLTL